MRTAKKEWLLKVIDLLYNTCIDQGGFNCL
jgi:hypothetical protein